MQVVPEPVAQWQEYRCRDAEGVEKPVNVLEKFYSNPQRFAYSFQHYVLMSRMQAVRSRTQAVQLLSWRGRGSWADRAVRGSANACLLAALPPERCQLPPSCLQDRQSRDCDKALRVVERSIFSDRQVGPSSAVAGAIWFLSQPCRPLLPPPLP